MSLGNERGMVLLLVLVVVALLSALLSDFAFSTLIDMRLTETFRDTTRAEYLSRGGITAGRLILQGDKNTYDALDDPAEFWSIGVQDYPLAEGTISVKISDLEGRLQLNKLVDQQGNLNPVNRERFINLCQELALNAPDDLAAALIDWLDPDSDPEPGGAEDAYYLSLDQPYEAADAQLHSISELQLIRGFDAETFARLEPFVSSYGSGKLNINTATAELLHIWDHESAGAGIDNLLNRREEGPYKNLNELRDALGVEDYTALNRQLDLKVSSSYYLIDSRGQVNDGTRRMQAIVNKAGDKLLWQKVN